MLSYNRRFLNVIIVSLMIINFWPLFYDNLSAGEKIPKASEHNVFFSDYFYGGEDILKYVDSVSLVNVEKNNTAALVQDVHYYYCIVSPKLLERFKCLCDENSAVYEILPEFKHLKLWKRSGIIVDIQFTAETSDYIEQLVEIWNATPFCDVEISVTLKTGDLFIVKEKIIEFKKGYDMVKYACTIIQPGINCTLFKGVNLIFHDMFDGIKKLHDPHLVITMKAVHKITREKTLMFYKEYGFSGTADIKHNNKNRI